VDPNQAAYNPQDEQHRFASNAKEFVRLLQSEFPWVSISPTVVPHILRHSGGINSGQHMGQIENIPTKANQRTRTHSKLRNLSATTVRKIQSNQHAAILRLGAKAEKLFFRISLPYKPGLGQKRHKMTGPVFSVAPVAGVLKALSDVVGTQAHCRELLHRQFHRSWLVIDQSS